MEYMAAHPELCSGGVAAQANVRTTIGFIEGLAKAGLKIMAADIKCFHHVA